MTRSKRFERREERSVNRDTFVQEEPSLGLMVMDSPDDPKPSLRLDNGRVVEIDGRIESEFDVIDRYIARYAINTTTAEEAMATDSLQLARMLVDINTPRKRLVQLLSGCTPHGEFLRIEPSRQRQQKFLAPNGVGYDGFERKQVVIGNGL